ncbi:RxLR-like protein [Plasmopara halstedii]|uniref:RxLR-like protein n=1 Tax=Plasmopara halstedii TaxID=4781 RepID=A0A0P1B6I4_PLAHL|nr:RxLR-like protein [Plasmopara halstedii]CEG49857.1 RxLR-like protein [Plasmopara halstedii]|eukprot:XP_024586226.1 RxLR-like protein [Plasmopara halstedii]
MTLGRYTIIAAAVALCANVKSANATDDFNVLHGQPTIPAALNAEDAARAITTRLLRGSNKTAKSKTAFDEILEERGIYPSELARSHQVAISSGGGGKTHDHRKQLLD